MENDINEILNNLTDKDIDTLKQAAASIFGNNEVTKEDKKEKLDIVEDNPLSQINLGAVMNTLKGLNRNDPRLDLIRSLKPMLSPPRQQKADEAIRMLRLFDMLPALQKSGILGDILK